MWDTLEERPDPKDLRSALSINLEVKKTHPNAKMPHVVEGAAGFDLSCVEDVVLLPYRSTKVNTGIAIRIPKNYELQVRGRSGLAFKQNILLAHFGTIDHGYLDTIYVLLTNQTDNTQTLEAGCRICQLVLAEVIPKMFSLVTEFTESAFNRGGGLGSTGLK
jgi:dUTP pyrophosphatase